MVVSQVGFALLAIRFAVLGYGRGFDRGFTHVAVMTAFAPLATSLSSDDTGLSVELGLASCRPHTHSSKAPSSAGGTFSLPLLFCVLCVLAALPASAFLTLCPGPSGGASRRSFALYIALSAATAQLTRLATYYFAVLPLGALLPYNECNTEKSISGHTHLCVERAAPSREIPGSPTRGPTAHTRRTTMYH